MNTFVLVIFWVFVVAFGLRVLITAFSKYPRKVEYSLGVDVAGMMLRIPFFLWAAYLLWA